MHSPRDGPLRYRGVQEDSKDHRLINVEQQPVMYNQRGEGTKTKLLCLPDSSFSSNWTSAICIVVFVGYLLLMTLLVNIIHHNLPPPKNFDAPPTAQDDSDSFIAARAQVDLNALISMGPRPVGSAENEVLAHDFLQREISKIKEKSSHAHIISTADQTASGSFYIHQKIGYASFYDNVQNIVVRVSPRNKTNSFAVLMNCHYDTVPGSPGAGDDAFHCAVMLEILRVLSQMNKPFLHDIIFLFNGAEESGLQASHAFITQHKWAQDVKAFINLEGCGGGGKEILFQTGPNCPWLVETYGSAVPRPHGSVMAEEMFQSGIIPSDTDFRIFRDFGHIPGIDFANTYNGFVYHTRFDNEKVISLGSHQHTGDNVLALVLALANSPLLGTGCQSGGSMVFYDILGLWFINYSKTLGVILNIVTVLWSAFTIVRVLKTHKDSGVHQFDINRSFVYSTLGIVLGWTFSILYIFLLSTFINWMKCTQSWYRSSLYQLCLYYCPTILFCILGPFAVLHRLPKLTSMQRAQMSSLGTQFLWTTILLISIFMGIRSSFLITLLLLGPTIVNTVVIFFRNCSARMWISLQCLQTLVPVVIGIYYTILLMAVIVPITNRSGSSLNVELIVGVLSAATCIMVISFLVPLSMFIRHVSVIATLAAVHLLGVIFVLVVQPFPFYEWPSGESGVLQRVPLWHVERTLYDEYGNTRLSDSGFWVMSMDPSSPYHLKKVVTEFNSAEDAASLCDSELFCALPLYSPRMANFVRQSSWIRSPKPFAQPIFQMNTQTEELTPTKKRITFTISGPQQMGFMFSPLPGVAASSWSLQANLTPSITFKERPAFFVFYQRGLDGSPWTFFIDFVINQSTEMKKSDKGTVTVGLSGSHIDPGLFSSEFKLFINKFPRWAFLSPRASEIKIWEL